MTERAVLRNGPLVPLLVVILIAFAVAVLYPVPSLIVPVTVFLAGLAGLMSSVHLHSRLQSADWVRLGLAIANFFLTTTLVFFALKALVQAIS